MRRKSPYRGMLRHVRANWPTYVLLYGGVVLALLLIGLSLDRGWLSFVPLSLAMMLLLAYFFAAGLWSAHQLYDPAGLRPHVALFEMGRLEAEDSFVYVDLGARDFALQLSRRLSSGKIYVVDVYNPQWTTSGSLKRYRARQPHAVNDPRLVWQNGRFDLLPLPDKSVSTVILCQILSEFWLEGDRAALLREAHRVLTPNGKLLLAERVRGQTNWLVLGPTAVRLPPADYWRDSLQEAGFMLRGEQDLHGLIHCFRADKPSAAQARQLALNLPL
jgi:SAM-dependent methyltransferase